MYLQVVKQAIKLSFVSLGCCFKDSLPSECLTENVVNTDRLLSEMQKITEVMSCILWFQVFKYSVTLTLTLTLQDVWISLA